MEQIVKTSEINIRVGLDKDQYPVQLEWSAADAPNGSDPQECKALVLAFFDKANQDTFRIDLWTAEMQVGEMDKFFFQTLRTLADTYYRATQNAQMATAMQQFSEYFGEQTGLLKKAE